MTICYLLIHYWFRPLIMSWSDGFEWRALESFYSSTFFWVSLFFLFQGLKVELFVFLSHPLTLSAAGVSASFGEMLLLVAMYFHSNQLSAIIELVCSTLGMKVRGHWQQPACVGLSYDSKSRYTLALRLTWILPFRNYSYHKYCTVQ